jgi:FkbM family methyltransferase
VEILNTKAEMDAHWRIYHCALGAENTIKTINVMHASTLSSFLDPDNSITNLYSSYNVVDHTENVQLRTLDTVLDEIQVQYDFEWRLFLKMDTQGYDMEVIKGAEKSLSEILAVQTELSCQNIYKKMPGYLEILAALNKRGYQMSGMFPVSQDTLLRIIECDSVLVNGALLNNEGIRPMWTKEV